MRAVLNPSPSRAATNLPVGLRTSGFAFCGAWNEWNRGNVAPLWGGAPKVKLK